MGKLTEKQKKFVNEYLIDLNATQAAIRSGYSEKNAFKIGSELLHKSTVSKYLQTRQQALQQRTEVTQEMVIKELASIGFADVIDYAEVVEKKYIDENGKERSYADVDIKVTANIPINKRKAVSSIKQGKNGIEIKLNDKVKALELLGKHLGMFKDNEANQTKDNGLNTAIEKSAEEVWIDEIRKDKPQANEGLDMVGGAEDCK